MRTLAKIIKSYPILTALLAMAILLEIITTSHIMLEPHPWDWVIHFILPAILSQVLYVFLIDYHILSRSKEKISRFSWSRVILMTLFIGTSIGVWWEIAEFISDHLFGTHLQLGNSDTMGDLIADSLGSLFGGIVLVFLSKIREK